MKKVLIITIAIVGICFGSYLSFAQKTASLDTAPVVKVAFIGDQGLGTSSRAVLELIKREDTDLLLHQGDFDYEDNPEAWYKEVTEVLGKGFPILGTLGNHDVEKKQAAYEHILQQLVEESSNLACWGKVGSHARCRFENIHIVSVAPGVIAGEYGPYIKDALASSTDTWNICVWHKNQESMQVGEKKSETGWPVYNRCKDAGAMIVTAHEHSYSRSYLLDTLHPTLHIATRSSTLALEPGKTFVVVSGLGGKSIRPQKTDNPWWASIYSETQQAAPGAFFCIFNAGGNTHKAFCYFKDINNKIVDSFTVTR